MMGKCAVAAGKFSRMASRSMSVQRMREIELLDMFVIRPVTSPKFCSSSARLVMSLVVGARKIAASSA